MSQPKAAASPTSASPQPLVSPFARLTALLTGIEPGLTPIDMSVGEPRHPMPAFLREALDRSLAGFGKYPAIRGMPELRKAIVEWMARRYPATQGKIDPETNVIATAGSREALFLAFFPALARKAHLERPAVLMPNPFYPAYAAAPSIGIAESVLLNTSHNTGFLPDLDSIAKADLERAIAFYLASPSNPQGAVAARDYLARAIGLAREHDFMLFADECYGELYKDEPPPGALEVAIETFGDVRNLVAFQSLSKRSNLPGLRSGFCAGDAKFIDAFATFRNVAAPQLPLPVQHVSLAAWSEEGHVEASRALYAAKFDAASRILGTRYGYRRPAGGFFLWLDMSRHGGGELVAKTLWQGCGVRVLPGGFLAQSSPGEPNPGAAYVRLALVDDLKTTEEGLARVVAELG